MTDLAFAGYRAFDAAPDDPLRLKWLSMDKNTMRSYAVQKSLASVGEFNLGINREIKFDAVEAESLDAWQSPQQTLTSGHGDCKDYALLKYSLLMHKGIEARVVLGGIASLDAPDGRWPHAWCAAFIEGIWYALDNKFDHLERLPYLNWIPVAAMHDDQVVRFGREFSMNEMMKGETS